MCTYVKAHSGHSRGYWKPYISILEHREEISRRPIFDIGRPVISQDFSWFQVFFYKSPFASKFSWKKRSSHQGKKVHVRSLYCVQTSSFLFVSGCGESVNPPKLNIQEVQGALSSRPKGDPGLLHVYMYMFMLGTHFSELITFVKSYHCISDILGKSAVLWYLYTCTVYMYMYVHVSPKI